jgi:hypothetical protein
VASLPTGAVGKGAFAEGFWQLCSATLGNIFPARVFPALPSVVAQGSRQRIFFKKNKKLSLPTAFARGARHRFFSKKINKNSPICRRPGLEAVGKEDFKNRQPNPPLTATFLADGPLWALGKGCAESLELGCSTKSCGREKILREACAERDRQQSRCRRFVGLCREFPALGKAWISSSEILSLGASLKTGPANPQD